MAGQHGTSVSRAPPSATAAGRSGSQGLPGLSARHVPPTRASWSMTRLPLWEAYYRHGVWGCDSASLPQRVPVGLLPCGSAGRLRFAPFLARGSQRSHAGGPLGKTYRLPWLRRPLSARQTSNRRFGQEETPRFHGQPCRLDD
ncbi:hypothetical protein Micbo1qcDRAFT_23403 [Microdochium bolleyi]|uniref:Uncharacterized protein n=1 Tax=Microdochium bolleyi TaxID=196109 RepID=A0A136JCQ6_9PEZI|nr:hypothetical protein Micbo1qcDRAFT_23403 [Microdochium bolleyi]